MNVVYIPPSSIRRSCRAGSQRGVLNQVLLVDQEWESGLVPKTGSGSLNNVLNAQRTFTGQLTNSDTPPHPMCDSM